MQRFHTSQTSSIYFDISIHFIPLLIMLFFLQIWECEFYILEAMDCSLIVFHPYRSLTKYLADMGQEDALLPIAWRIVNDSLRTDVCLMHPPYLISLTAIYMACVIQQKDCKQWFAELNVEMQKIMEITQQVLALYELWKAYDEKKEISSILVKMPKPRSGPNSRPSSATPRNHTPSPVPGLH